VLPYSLSYALHVFLSLRQSSEGSYFAFVVAVSRALAQPIAILLETAHAAPGETMLLNRKGFGW